MDITSSLVGKAYEIYLSLSVEESSQHDYVKTTIYVCMYDQVRPVERISEGALTARDKEVSDFVTPDGLYQYKVSMRNTCNLPMSNQ